METFRARIRRRKSRWAPLPVKCARVSSDVFNVDGNRWVPQECFNVYFYWTSYAKYPNDLTSKQEMANMYKINTLLGLTPSSATTAAVDVSLALFLFLLRDSHNCIAKISHLLAWRKARDALNSSNFPYNFFPSLHFIELHTPKEERTRLITWYTEYIGSDFISLFLLSLPFLSRLGYSACSRLCSSRVI